MSQDYETNQPHLCRGEKDPRSRGSLPTTGPTPLITKPPPNGRARDTHCLRDGWEPSWCQTNLLPTGTVGHSSSELYSSTGGGVGITTSTIFCTGVVRVWSDEKREVSSCAYSGTPEPVTRRRNRTERGVRPGVTRRH